MHLQEDVKEDSLKINRNTVLLVVKYATVAGSKKAKLLTCWATLAAQKDSAPWTRLYAVL